ncbi:hypothetical protein PHET_08174 [Paragonimus heterotremus]|uniref:Uncharacterized protein n=1 Tax=Paragonimus heterotremus TaxID=100268 RepID=A0A8J4WPP0_9TREM|nr:hypothetical protein PHET_08174 [Paragonimus heterotremus]
MNSVPRRRPGHTTDLISFDNDVDMNVDHVSEIRKLFDPLFEAKPSKANAPTYKSSSISNLTSLISLPTDFSSSLSRVPDPLSTETLSPGIPARNHDYSSNIVDFLSEFAPAEKTVADKSKNEAFYSILDLPGIEGYEKSGRPENIDFLDVGGPRLLRRRKSPKERELVFIPNSQASSELRRFVSGIEYFFLEQKHNASPDISSDSSTFQLENLSSFDLPAVRKMDWNAASVAFDPVYGHLVTVQTHKNSLTPERSCSEEKLCNPSWTTVAGARSVAHVRPLPTFKSDLDAEAPSHWKNTDRWIIPQLEVRITTHLRAGRKLALNKSSNPPTSTYCPTFADTDSPDPTTPVNRNSTVPVTSRIRLVCDPNSTLVSELLMEALANDSVTPYEPNPSANDYQLRLHGRAELLHP